MFEPEPGHSYRYSTLQEDQPDAGQEVSIEQAAKSSSNGQYPGQKVFAFFFDNDLFEDGQGGHTDTRQGAGSSRHRTGRQVEDNRYAHKDSAVCLELAPGSVSILQGEDGHRYRANVVFDHHRIEDAVAELAAQDDNVKRCVEEPGRTRRGRHGAFDHGHDKAQMHYGRKDKGQEAKEPHFDRVAREGHVYYDRIPHSVDPPGLGVVIEP